MDTTFGIGATVRIKQYKVQTLYGDYVTAYNCGKTAVLLKLRKDYDWRSSDNQAVLRVIDGDNRSAHVHTQDLEHLELLERGTGRVELGVTHPWTAAELRDQRWAAFCERVAAVDLRHQGFRNAATFLAWLYLNQEPRAHRELRQHIRRDGTANPLWSAKLFKTLGLTVDAWAFECPLDLPPEFAGRNNPVKAALRVDWDEVTKMFEPRAMAA